MLQDVVLAVGRGLEQGPPLQRLEPDLVRQLLEDILSRVLWVDVQRFCPTVQEEETTNDGSESLHGLLNVRQIIHFDI